MRFLSDVLDAWWKRTTEFCNAIGPVEFALLLAASGVLLLVAVFVGKEVGAAVCTGILLTYVFGPFLYRPVSAKAAAITPSPEFREQLRVRLWRAIEASKLGVPPAHVMDAPVETGASIYESQQLLPPPPPTDPNLLEKYKTTLALWPAAPQKVADAISEALIIYLSHVKRFSHEDYELPAYDLVPVHEMIDDMIKPFRSEELNALNLCSSVRDTYLINLGAVATTANAKELVYPRDYKGPPAEVVSAYLQAHPLQNLFELKLPFGFDDDWRREHELIVAGSGHGKTQLMEYQILQDLLRSDPPGLVVIDSKADMIKRIARLALFDPENGRLKDRLIIIDPREVPALNPFDLKLSAFEHLDQETRDQTMNSLIDDLSYVINTLMGAEVFPTMKLVSRPLAELMLHVPGANLQTMLNALEDIRNPKLTEHFYKLRPVVRHFLENDFTALMDTATQRTVKRRVHAIRLDTPSFEAMFNAVANKLDLGAALQTGKIVLVSTEVGFLKGDLSSAFGKFILSKVMSAAREHAAVPEQKNRSQAYIYIDDAKAYIDEVKTQELFSTMRSCGFGLIMAFQQFGQIPASLRSMIDANTAIKLIGGRDAAAAAMFAEDLHTSSQFILNQTKDKQRPPRFTRFACYVKNAGLRSAVSLTIPIYDHGRATALDRQPQMSEEAYKRMRVANRAKYTSPVLALSPPPQRSQPTPQMHDADIPMAPDQRP
jgi:hypothetical protein